MKRLFSFVILIAGASLLATQAAYTQTQPTPLGIYRKHLYEEVGRIWYHHVLDNSGSLRVGVVKLTFRITAEGRVENLKILSNTSNRKAANIAVQAIKEAKLAPLSKNILTLLAEQGEDSIEEEMSFTLYPK